MSSVFIFKKNTEINLIENPIVQNKSKQKVYTKKNYSTLKNFSKTNQIKICNKFSLMMNLIKLDVFYEDPIFFNFLINLLEEYFMYQENCYEEVIFGLNIFEIALSNIEKRYLTENFGSNNYKLKIKYIINFFSHNSKSRENNENFY